MHTKFGRQTTQRPLGWPSAC